MSKNQKEYRAVRAQMNHPSYAKTRQIEYQNVIKNYGARYGLFISPSPLYSPF